MSRISTSAANALLVQQIFRTQQRVIDGEVQVTSEKKSDDYQGIAIDSQHLVNIEHTRDALNRYITNNEQMDVRLEVRETVLEGIYDTIKDFRSELRTYGTFNPKDSERVQDIQDAALRGLKNLQDLLNTDVNGRYLFAGTRVTTQPVDFGLTTLSSFQSTYDGARVTVPTTRDAHLADFSIASDTNNENKQYITDGNFLQFRQEELYDIQFTNGTNTISALKKSDGSAAGSVFSSLSVGDTITVTGTNSNNATFTVATVASDGSSITVNEAVTSEFDIDGVTFSGDLALTPGTGKSTIEASSAMFSNVSAGTLITITNTTNNNGTYSVESVSSDGRTITVKTEMLRNETGASSASITYPDPVDPTKTLTLNSATLGTLSFTRSSSTIAATGSLSNLAVGTTFTVAGTTHNNGTYTVSSNDGTNLVIESLKLTDEGTTSANSSAATFFDMFTQTDVRFDTTDNSIEIRRSGAATAVTDIFEGLAVGNQITVANSDNNNGTYTIASISSDGSKITVNEALALTETDSAGVTFAGVGDVSFNYESKAELVFTDVGAAGTDTIHIRDIADATITTGVFSNMKVGQEFTVSGSAGGVDGVYTIKSISSDGSTITVDQEISATVTEDTNEVRMQVFSVSGTVAATNYYSGDERSTTHRVNKDRSFELDFNAIDPAIEKAVRAMKLIMQGEFGTEGGLDQNDTRVNQALYLLDASMERTVGGTAPFGTELDGNMTEARSSNAFSRVLISNINQQSTTLVGFFDSRIAEIENVDQTEAITRLLDDQRALEASYQIFSRIRQLSLTNYI